jgi:hypothetical protein
MKQKQFRLLQKSACNADLILSKETKRDAYKSSEINYAENLFN